MTSKIKDLKANKVMLLARLNALDEALREGSIDKKTYIDRKHILLNGNFKDDVIRAFDREIEKESNKGKKTIKILSTIIVAWLVIIVAFQSGLTSLVIFGDDNTSQLPISKDYTGDVLEDLSFIKATSVRLNGNINGYGRTWIYLVSDQTERLVYYADTRSERSIVTGFVVGNPINETNTTHVNETNQTNATANNNATNSTNATIAVNETNQTIVNQTEINATINETNQTSPDFLPEITSGKNSYSLGDNITINITPEGADVTLYVHSPSDSYILDKMYWIATEPGDHTITALVTQGENTERVSTTFYVRSLLEEETASFIQACVETCVIEETPVVLRIVTENTSVNIESLAYTGSSLIEDQPIDPPEPLPEPTNNTNETNTEEKKEVPIISGSECSDPDPNKRPLHCLQQNQDYYFAPQPIYLEDLDRLVVARITPIGNLQIKGDVIEESTLIAGDRDFKVIKDSGLGRTEVVAWISKATGNLHLKGNLFEESITLAPTKGSYSIQNKQSITVAYFDRATGDLHIRGNLIPFRKSLGGGT